MAKPLISDELWSLIQPLLPPERPKPKGGRPREIDDRAALTGIFVRARPALVAAVLAHLPLAFAQHLQARAIYHQMQAARAARAALVQPHLQAGAPPAQGRVVRHRQVGSQQTKQRGEQPLRRSQG